MSSYEYTNNKETDAFFKYLEEHGVLDQITNTLIKLYNESEKPSDPIEFMRTNMCADNPDVKEIAELEILITTVNDELATLLNIRDNLRIKLEQFENETYEQGEEEEEISTLLVLDDIEEGVERSA